MNLLAALTSLAEALLKNLPFVVALVALSLSQAIKFLYYFAKDRKPTYKYLVSTGGMPSSHVAMIISLTTAVAIKTGLGSALFAAAFIFSIIVVYDAIGVRQAAGHHARTLNQVIGELSQRKLLPENGLYKKSLKELLGHSPSEVIIGGIIGFFTTLIVFQLFYS